MSSERSVKDLFGLYTFIFGGADGIRTHDLLDAIEARSQLRHGPTGSISDVSIRALDSSMRWPPISCCLRTEHDHRVSRIFQLLKKALIDGKFTPKVSDSLPTLFCACEYGEDLIEENNRFLSPVVETSASGHGHFNFE